MNEVLLELSNVIKNTKDFALEQIPLVAQEILNYNTWCYSTGLGVSITILFFGIWLLFFKSKKNPCLREQEVIGLYGLVLSIGGLVFVVINTLQLLKIVFTPRLYLIEYLVK